MKGLPWWVVALIAAAAAGVAIFVVTRPGDEVVSPELSAPRGSAAPEENEDLENLRHLKEMARQNGNR